MQALLNGSNRNQSGFSSNGFHSASGNGQTHPRSKPNPKAKCVSTSKPNVGQAYAYRRGSLQPTQRLSSINNLHEGSPLLGQHIRRMSETSQTTHKLCPTQIQYFRKLENDSVPIVPIFPNNFEESVASFAESQRSDSNFTTKVAINGFSGKSQNGFVDRSEIWKGLNVTHWNQKNNRVNISGSPQSVSSPREIRLRALEVQVQSLREQLTETTNRLNETQTENEQLRHAFHDSGIVRNEENAKDLRQLRNCLTAAEADVIRQQEAMDVLKSKLEQQDAIVPSNEYDAAGNSSGEEDKFTSEISRRLISLLKVQVGALSKMLHSSCQSQKLSPLRAHVDNCIRTVASLDENEPNLLPENPNQSILEGAFDEVVRAYEKLSDLLSQDTFEAAENDPENNSKMNLLQEIRDLEHEMEDLQAHHSEELVGQRGEYERQIRQLKERIEHEEICKKQLQEELQTIGTIGSFNASGPSSEKKIADIKNEYEATIRELRKEFDERLEILRREHRVELDDEKQATRLALDAVHRMHENELQGLHTKLNNCQEELDRLHQVSAAQTNRQNIENVEGDHSTDESNHAKMTMEKLGTELRNLSALYSAKCLENSRLDEKMQQILADKDNNAAVSEIESQNIKKLQRELNQKETSIEELKQKIEWLERKLKIHGVELTEQDQSRLKSETDSANPCLSPVPIKLDEKRKLSTLAEPIISVPNPIPQEEMAAMSHQTKVRFRPPPQNKTQPLGSIGGSPGPGLRKLAATNRRNDVRYHSNPVIPIFNSPNISENGSILLTNDDSTILLPSNAVTFAQCNFSKMPSLNLPNTLMNKLCADDVSRRSLAIPVSERRKFFERVAEYNTSF